MTGTAARVVPFGIAVTVAFLAALLLAIVARSPYTHANLDVRLDPLYSRTDPIMVGPAVAYAGISPSRLAPAADGIPAGARLYLTKGCVACHGLDAQGGTVGPAIAGSDVRAVLHRTREPTRGMPRYSAGTLSDDEVAAIVAYLVSLPVPAAR